MEKIWRCVVCGYLHTGDSPPATCPICHADASQFELVNDAAANEVAAEEVVEVPEQQGSLLQEMLDGFVPHAVMAHFPNALLPTTVLFLFLFLLFGESSFESTSFSLLLVAVVTVPPTFASGIYDWKKHYSGQAAPIFKRKILLATALTVLGLVALVWRWQAPTLLTTGGWPAWLFVLLVLVMLGCVTLLGHYGGMLVFSSSVQRKK